ncbi:Uncharacterised protein [Pantoea agglomerans]|nr:Uncharacterised protein [Pantoea agglomerans]
MRQDFVNNSVMIIEKYFHQSFQYKIKRFSFKFDSGGILALNEIIDDVPDF